MAAPWPAPALVPKTVVQAAAPDAFAEDTSHEAPALALVADEHKPVSVIALACMGTMACGRKERRLVGMRATLEPSAGVGDTGPQAARRM